MTTEYIEPPDDDLVPFDVTEEVEVGDLSDQEGGTLPAATRVVGEIKKASVKRNLIDNKYDERPDNPCTFKYLHLEIKIGPDGIDGEGTYAGKHVFTSMMDIVLAYDEAACRMKAESQKDRNGQPKKFNAHWWAKEARYGAKQFFVAINGDARNVRVNDDYLLSLLGQPIMFDIKREKDTDRGEGGNRLQNWRAVGAGVDE